MRDDDLSYQLIQIVDNLKNMKESAARNSKEAKIIAQVSEYVFELNSTLSFKSQKDLGEEEKKL